MQPDEIKPMSTAEKETGANTKFGDVPGKQKENSVKRELTPAEQWDRVAHTLIIQELAPKGFKDMKGEWKGKVASNIPFLSQQSVTRCQNIAAQLVRVYREEAKRELQSHLKIGEEYEKQQESRYKNTPWWRFKSKREWKEVWIKTSASVREVRLFIVMLDQIKIPTK
jgi:hypothetical protein